MNFQEEGRKRKQPPPTPSKEGRTNASKESSGDSDFYSLVENKKCGCKPQPHFLTKLILMSVR
ncbi:MAG TPA: hypothetical protein DHV48_00375 [Prolixibacteraceae bacterium]|nr:hypothetical protein [Prolixibacteraceae bacterium]